MIRDARGGYNRKVVNENFFKTWSPNMAYVLGFMFADGSLLDTNFSSRTYYLLFSNNDLDLLNKIRRILSSEHKIYVRPPRVMEHREKKYISKTSYLLKFGNKSMYNDLLDLGMTHRKSNNMHLPIVPTELFSYFLRGYFDGDGCVNIYLPKNRVTPRIKVLFTSGSTEFLSELSLKLSQILNMKTLSYYRSMGAHNLMASDSTAVRVLDYMYMGLNEVPYLKRKYQKYINYRTNQMGPRVSKALENI